MSEEEKRQVSERIEEYTLQNSTRAMDLTRNGLHFGKREARKERKKESPREAREGEDDRINVVKLLKCKHRHTHDQI